MARIVVPILWTLLLTTGERCAAEVPRAPVATGEGEVLVTVGQLPSDVEQAVERELGQEIEVGFFYQRRFILWCTVWTSRGRHVLRSGDRYWKLPPEAWRELLGELPSERYPTPFLYRVPLGWILGGSVLLFLAWGHLSSTKSGRGALVSVLLDDPDYVAATAVMFGFDPNDEPPFVTEVHVEDIERAAAELVARGKSHEVAMTDLRLIADFVISKNNEHVDGQLRRARDLERDDEWTECEAVYQELVDLVPTSDPRWAGARSGLDAARAEASQRGT